MSSILDTAINSFQLFIDSSHAKKNNETSLSDISVELNNSIVTNPEIELLMGIQQFSFCNSFYNINEYNQHFYYRFSTTIYSHTIPKGNYDIDQLISYLNENVLDNFSFAYDEITMKVTISNTQSFNLVHSTYNVFDVIGFIISPAYTISKVSDHIINLTGMQDVLNITINNFSSLNSFVNTHDNIVLSTIVTAAKGEYQSNVYSSSFRNVLNTTVIDRFDIIVYDRMFRKVDFNNIHWSMTLSFDFVKRREIPFMQYLLSNSELFNPLEYLEKVNNIDTNNSNNKENKNN